MVSARRNRCTVCLDERVTYLNARALKGESFTALGEEFGYNRVTIGRHVRQHLPPSAVTVSRPGRKPAGGNPLLPVAELDVAPDASAADRLRVLVARLEGQMIAAEASGSMRSVTDLARELRGAVRELSRLDGEGGGSGAAVDLATSAEWVAVRSALMAALAPHPDARRDVVEALSRLGAGEPQVPALSAEHPAPVHADRPDAYAPQTRDLAPAGGTS